MNDKYTQKKVNELELTVRTIEEMLPEMPTVSLQKWHSIFKTAMLKVEKEMTASCLHTCRICFREEWGYRDELPSHWYIKGSAEICFEHDYNQAEKLLKDAGFVDDAFFPPEVPVVTLEALKVTMDHLPPPPTQAEQTLEELMDLL